MGFRKHGILTRYYTSPEMVNNLRISIGLPEQMKKFLNIFFEKYASRNIFFAKCLIFFPSKLNAAERELFKNHLIFTIHRIGETFYTLFFSGHFFCEKNK